MHWYVIFGILGLLAIGFIVMLVITLPISKRVYNKQLVRTSLSVWGRECSAPDNEEQLAMWEEGLEFERENHSFKIEEKIVVDGLNLYGEYFDFGSDSAVIILPGRCESLMYSYYFASPYKKAGYNVLVIDTRCHGRSDGKYASIGRKESKDVVYWANLLKEKYGVKKICLHCICIGSASAILALRRKDCPSEIKELVTEGCFSTFRASFKWHMVEEKRPLFPVLDSVMLLLYLKTGTNVIASSPIMNIGKIKKDVRVMFLHSKKDKFSKPEQAEKLIKKCKNKDKKLVWFDEGGHSHVRINNKEKYDGEIVKFLSEGKEAK